MLAVLIGVALSAGAFYLSTGLGELWPLAWVAPVPVLWLAFSDERRRVFLPATLAFFLGSLNLFSYLARIAPLPIVVGSLLVPALAFGGAVVFARRAARTLSPWLAVFAFPAAWTTYEFLLSLVSPHGTAISLGYSQTDVLPVLQMVSVTGLWGLVFLLTLVPSGVALALVRRSMAPLLPALALAVVVMGFGLLRLHEPGPTESVRVGLAVTDHDIERVFNTEDPAKALAIARGYADRVRRLGAKGAHLVVLPEKLSGVTPADTSEVERLFADAALEAKTTLVVGLNRVGIQPLRNVAIVYGPDGRQLVEYDKHHMLPGAESGYLVGTTPALFAAGGEPWGVAICKDMDFQGWSRKYAAQGVRLLAVPAWDFSVDAKLHWRMALVRSVENGFAMARAAEQGLLTVTDGYGRLIDGVRSDSGAEALVVADVAPGPGPTFYTRTGDWCGWLAVCALVAIAAAPRGQRQAAL